MEGSLSQNTTLLFNESAHMFRKLLIAFFRQISRI